MASEASARAAAAYRAGDFAAAVNTYSEALAIAEGAEARASVLVSRAQCHLKLGQAAEGREDAAAARALAPQNPKAWYRLGICEARLGRLSEAEEALAQAAALRPKDPDTLGALSAVRRRLAEAGGRFAWPEVYAAYLGKAPDPGGGAVGSGAGAAAAAGNADGAASSVDACLDVEPFVGHVRVGMASGRGRGLFATTPVAAGTLLMCAQAVATGSHEVLAERVAGLARRSPDLLEAVLLLSRGTAASEVGLPQLTPSQLAAPRQLPRGEASEESEVSLEEVQQVLYFNQFSLPRVNPNAAPIEVANDPGKSGLWLLPAFVNHSCCPNVQRVIVRDCLFLRAARDIEEGEELMDCYVEALQPLSRRRSQLDTYGIRPCCCDRCLFEEAVLPTKGVQAVLELAGRAKDAEHPGDVADRANEAAMEADALVARALSSALLDGRLPQACRLALPAAPVAAERVGLLREGFEPFADAAEEESFRRQEDLHRLLLGSLANVLRAYAVSLRGLNRQVDAAAAWSRVLDALEQVIPCSELAAIVSSEAFNARLLAFQLDYRKAAKDAFRRCVLRGHQAYGGGAAAWRVLNEQSYAKPVIEASEGVWLALREELGLPEDSYNPAALAPAASQADEPPGRELGFEDLLRRQARGSGAVPSAAGRPAASATAREAPGAAEAAAARRPTAAPPAATPAVAGWPTAAAAERAGAARCEGVKEGPGPGELQAAPAASSRPAAAAAERAGAARCEGVEEGPGPGELQVRLLLPGLASAAQASLEVSERELRVRSLLPELPHSLQVPLPRLVDPDSAIARWSRKAQRLTVRLRVAE